MSSPPNYPNAYCVKCGTHTETSDKHTVVLANQSRALRGVCPTCGSENYKILPAKNERAAATPLAQAAYPDAFCVKCKEHTPTLRARTIVLENQSRAVMGCCSRCGSDVYRILSAKNAAEESAKPTEKAASSSAVAAQRAPTMMGKPSGERPALELISKPAVPIRSQNAASAGQARPTRMRRHEVHAGTSSHVKPASRSVAKHTAGVAHISPAMPMRYGGKSFGADAVDFRARDTRRTPTMLVSARASYLFAACVITAIIGVFFALAMMV